MQEKQASAGLMRQIRNESRHGFILYFEENVNVDKKHVDYVNAAVKTAGFAESDIEFFIHLQQAGSAQVFLFVYPQNVSFSSGLFYSEVRKLRGPWRVDILKAFLDSQKIDEE